jgi:hypothetical protein
MIFLMIILTTFSTQSGHSSNYSRLVNELSLDVEEVNRIITEVIAGQSIQDWDRAVILLRVQKKDGEYEVRGTKINKVHFGWLLRGKKDRIFGFFEYSGKEVLVFGESADRFFSKTDRTRTFEFLEIKPEKEINEIPQPPPVFEPKVWIYNYVNGDLVFRMIDYGDPLE